MKLRKALDKAKTLRETPLTEEEARALPDYVPMNGHKNPAVQPKGIKINPIYYQSRCIPVDPDIVAANRGVCINPDTCEIQRYKILRASIRQKTQGQGLHTIMITSANKREGKTVNAINMGLTFARDLNQTVLLVDCDFTGQDVHRYMGIESEGSLIDYFLDGVPLNQLIIWPKIEKFSLISGNRTATDSSELLSSDAMKHLIQEMKERYDDRYVLFDAPPVLDHSEAISMAPLVDGILMVVEAGVTSRKDVLKAVSMLPGDKVIGFILNNKG